MMMECDWAKYNVATDIIAQVALIDEEDEEEEGDKLQWCWPGSECKGKTCVEISIDGN